MVNVFCCIVFTNLKLLPESCVTTHSFDSEMKCLWFVFPLLIFSKKTSYGLVALSLTSPICHDGFILINNLDLSLNGA